MASSMIGVLLNPAVVIIFIMVFTLSAVILMIKHKSLSITQNAVFSIVCILCFLYFMFILWLIAEFGTSRPANDPTPDLTAAVLTDGLF